MNLRDTLDMSTKGEFSNNLFALYDYMIQRLTDANVQNSLKIMDEVINLMLPIKTAWAQIPEAAKHEAYEAQRQKRQAAV
jgi:flagellar protein FliS